MSDHTALEELAESFLEILINHGFTGKECELFFVLLGQIYNQGFEHGKNETLRILLETLSDQKKGGFS